MQALPIDPVLPELVRLVLERGAVVLEAPPGAGKTTRVPGALLDALPGKGEILVLEPRRLAARMAARRVAEERGERLGDTVGYQVRFEDVSSARTRIRFVTEGVLTRRLVSDRELRGVDAVVLDEFHERHLHGGRRARPRAPAAADHAARSPGGRHVGDPRRAPRRGVPRRRDRPIARADVRRRDRARRAGGRSPARPAGRQRGACGPARLARRTRAGLPSGRRGDSSGA